MDKRWIYILIILALALISGYFVVMESPKVGSAITNVNTSLVTLPADFEVSSKNSKSVTMGDGKIGEKIYLEDLGKKHVAFEKYNEILEDSAESDEVDNLRNSTNTTSQSITFYLISYENMTSDMNISKAYFEKNNHTFYIKLSNYTNVTSHDSDLKFLIDNLSPDYKKGRN